jgi:putative redox protein
MDVISILQKKRQDITGFEVRVDYQRAEEHPRVMTEAKVEYHVTGREVNESAVVRAIELSAVSYCPAQAMLSEIIPIHLEYFLYEENPDGDPSLVTRGVYQVTDGGEDS